jgi:hypothetical protein
MFVMEQTLLGKGLDDDVCDLINAVGEGELEAIDATIKDLGPVYDGEGQP